MSGLEADVVRSAEGSGVVAQQRARHTHSTARATTAFEEALTAAAGRAVDVPASVTVSRDEAGTKARRPTADGGESGKETGGPSGTVQEKSVRESSVREKSMQEPSVRGTPVHESSVHESSVHESSEPSEPGARSEAKLQGARTTDRPGRNLSPVTAGPALAPPASTATHTDIPVEERPARPSSSAGDRLTGSNTVDGDRTLGRSGDGGAQRVSEPTGPTEPTEPTGRTAPTELTGQNPEVSGSRAPRVTATDATSTRTQGTASAGSPRVSGSENADGAAAAGPRTAGGAATAADPGLDTTGAAAPRAATSTAPLPGVADQLVEVISAPRSLPGGGYTVSVALSPESLGQVEATVTLRAGDLSVHLAPSSPGGAAALRAALPELQAALASSDRRVSVVLATYHAASPSDGSASHHDTTAERGQSTRRLPPTSGMPQRASKGNGTATQTPRGDTHHLVDVRV